MTREEFERLLKASISEAIQTAQQQVSEPLPQRIRYELELRDKSGRESTLSEVLDSLLVGGMFSPVIDVAVKGASEDATIVWIRPSAFPVVSDSSQSWNAKATGPFKAAGLLLPSAYWDQGPSFKLDDLKKAAPSWAKAS